MSMPTPLKPKDKHNSLRIKLVNYLFSKLYDNFSHKIRASLVSSSQK